MWGFNFLLFMPVHYTVVYVILTAAAIILPFIKKTESISESIINGYSSVFCESSNRYYYRLAFTAVCTALFILFLADTHFLGDGYAVIANLATETGSFIKWSEMGVTHLLLSLQSMVGQKSDDAALAAFRMVSVFSGIFSVWIFFLISKEISEDKTKRFLTFLMLLMSGALLLFFGYAENYPLLWVAFPGFAYFGLRYINRDKWLIGPIIFLALGMFTHMQSVQMIPAFILLVFCKGMPRRLYDRFKIPFWILVGIIIAYLLMSFHHKYTTDLYIEDIFLPMFDGKPSDPGYLVFSLPHLADIFSQLLLLSPLVYLVLIISIKRLPRLFKRADTIFLLLLTLTGLGFMWVIDPKLGMPRDWDLLSLSAFGLTLVAVHLLGKRQIMALKRLAIPLIIYAVCASVPYLCMNLTADSAIKYVKYFIDLDVQKSLPATVVLRTYYKNQEYQPAVDSLDALYNKRYQNKIKIRQAINAMHSGDIETARRLAATVKPLRYFANYHDMLSNLYRHAGDQDRALQEYGKVISLQRYNSNVWLNRARTYISRRKFDLALYDLKQAYHLHNNSLNVFDGFATIHLYQKNWDSTVYYSEKMLAIDSVSYSAHYFMAVSYQYLGNTSKYIEHKDKYIQYGKIDQVYGKRLESMGIDLDTMKSQQESP